MRPLLLRLDRNEGPRPPGELFEALAAAGPELLRRYPDPGALEARIAARLGVAAEQVLATAGADEGIDRCLRAFLPSGRSLLLPVPTFEMLEHCAALVGGVVVRVPWPEGPFPAEQILARVDVGTSVIAVVSPNNPTGAVARRDDVARVAAEAPGTLVLLDHAYAEYAEQDLTDLALELPNVVVLRTFSKAWGLAGCRVGFAVGPTRLVAALRAAGSPFSVAGPSLALVAAALERGDEARAGHVARVKEERTRVAERLTGLGVTVRPSQTNFVLVDVGARAALVRAALRSLGVLVRDFPDRPELEGSLRITMPGDEADFTRLLAALEAVLGPEALP